MKEILDSGEYSDVQFLVGKGDKKEIVSAHRVILSVASDVFQTMFRYNEQNSKSAIGKDHATLKEPILVPDIEIGAFKTILTFIYTKNFNGLDANNLMDVLKAADKYNISGLVKECANFCANVSIQKLPNIFVAFEQALLLNMEDFALRCLRYIDQNMSVLFKSEIFLQIDQNLLYGILERDHLKSSEIEIWNAALRWADEKCHQNAIESSAEKRREKLGSALFNIRFPIIPEEEFTKSVVSTDVLTTEEVESIYQYNSHANLSDVPGLIKLKFPTQQRYKYEHTIEMEIEKMSEFALKGVGSRRLSDAVEIGGMPWKIMATIKRKNESNEKWLGFSLLCYVSEEDGNRSHRCSSETFRIVSQKNGTEDLIGTYNDRIFNKYSSSYFGFNYFISFSELMDASKGFYNKDEDNVELAIEVITYEPKTEKFISVPNKSNGTLSMEIEKLSEFEREIIGSERISEIVHIKGLPWKIGARIKKKNENNEKYWAFIFCAMLRKKMEIGVMNELMDASKGLYNKDEDKVKLAIDVIVEEPKAEKFISDPNKSNGTLSMEIEKLSEYAREIEGSERKSEAFHIKGMPWKMMAQIELMEPSKGLYNKEEDKPEAGKNARIRFEGGTVSFWGYRKPETNDIIRVDEVHCLKE
ncbi:hypothetical protein niasHT_016633 [Heterodera trifolii]|uniref:BTB domain-containing protein n=1 Tax=Heterodera trifolii TaxID=157864 RepID=A0ABD2LIW3_9BILA